MSPARDAATPQALFDMSGKVVVISGGGGKMGQGFASVLAHAGATVALCDLNGAVAQQAADEIATATGQTVVGFACDVANEAQVTELFRTIHERFGTVDVLVHNVMAKPPGYYRPFEEYPLETWDAAMAGNLTGAYLCCREASRYLGDRGAVVLTASIYGVVGPDERIYDGEAGANPYGGEDRLGAPGVYAASKAGIIGLARYLATHWGSRGIRVNVLTPGGVQDGQNASFVAGYEQRTPLGRMAEFSDYDGAILFLCSNASRYMTGANLVVDGGWTAW
jgi:NAD(P)-dependent dehydrogenase (short-subunit alcohol dehydrogenase family)